MQSEKSSNHYKDIIEQIKDLIATGVFSTGDKFPSERSLAEKFNVSRVPVREALKVLEYIGILKNVPNDGLYVSSLDISNIIEKFNFGLSINSQSVLSLFEVRISLEATACYYAAIRRTDEDIVQIRLVLDKMRALLKKAKIKDSDYEMLRLYSHEFHALLVRSAHNDILTGIYCSLFSLLELSKQYTIRREFDSYDSLLAHEAIFNKILSKDSNGARDDMVGHLVFARHKLEDAVSAETGKLDDTSNSDA
ncbi:FadR/GntR family transcriptional regulator [uncultured Sphaerochaeta sp.]|uniref:FadR/GntR family transcriptional regulator n=1 Tax=uncultured Sphaerochaeta sp. TaxID=886478 RepID=UPI002A0A1F74|nr:FadR/GntR family transcriptional regulator [uncultured Sphaerochaeta sp.]